MKWKKLLQNNSCIYALYIDFAKAFDVVAHDKLLLKVFNCGIRGNLLKWIADFLSERILSVISHNSLSRTRTVSSGVLQGSVFGVTLFSVFINDLPAAVGDDVDTDLFADDTKVYSNCLDKLKLAIVRIIEWCSQWGMRLAPEKSQLIMIRRRRLAAGQESVDVDGSTILSTTTLRDLGVEVSDDLEPEAHILQITKKAQRICNLLFRILRTKNIHIYIKRLS
jgi:hypothetical protein